MVENQQTKLIKGVDVSEIFSPSKDKRSKTGKVENNFVGQRSFLNDTLTNKDNF